MKPNPGHLPTEAIGKRVSGVLENGMPFSSWPADGGQGCRWKRTGHPFDIKQFEVIA